MSIPHVDVKAQYAPLIPQLQEAFARTLETGRFIFGPEGEAFEREAAALLGTQEAVSCANGTDALVLVLDAMGIGPGDEVICPAFTFYATAESIARRGATPVFADIDPLTLNLDPDDVASKITESTRAIMRVHLFGRPAAMDELDKLGVPLIEDAAQAFGAPGVAEQGTVSTYSFFPTKNLFCLGDGGLVATSDEELADRVQMLAFHGSRDKVDFDFVGYNSRLDELQAAILRVQLPHLDAWADGRRAAARHYMAAGLGELVALPVAVAGCDPAWHLYVVRDEHADELAQALSAAGIGNKAYYRTPIHRQPAMSGYRTAVELPATEEAARTHLAIPMSAVLAAEQASEVTAAVRAGGRGERATLVSAREGG